MIMDDPDERLLRTGQGEDAETGQEGTEEGDGDEGEYEGGDGTETGEPGEQSGGLVEASDETDEVGHRGRRDRRIEQVLRQAQEERERSNRLERELTQMRQRDEEYQRQRTQQSEDEWYTQQPIEVQVEYRMRKAEQQNKLELQKLQFQQAVQNDKFQYDTKSTYDPDMRRLAPKVEEVFLQQLQQGRYIERETVYTYLLGEEVKRAKLAQKPKKVPSEALRRQRVPAPNAGSDQPARPRGGQSLEDRLANIKF